MSGATRRLAAAALTAVALAVGACSDTGITTTPTPPQAGAPEDATPGTDRTCADDPRADARTEVVVNRGRMACPDVTLLLDQYYELAASGQFGNAGIVPDLRGFSCASPTARSAGIAGYGTRCADGVGGADPDTEILVRPSRPEIPGEQQITSDFIPEGSLTNGRSFFALPGGNAVCAIYPDHTPPNAACYGRMPAGLPEAPGLMGHLGPPTSVQVDEEAPARLTRGPEAPYPVDGIPFTTLEVGQSLASSGFACTVEAADRVTCSNAGGNGFVYSPDEVLVG